MELRLLTRRILLRVFSLHASFPSHSTSVRLWGKRCRRHINSSQQQQVQPNIFAVTVIVVALGRSLYFISFLVAC